MDSSLFVVLLVTIMSFLSEGLPDGVQEYCSSETFNIGCAENEVILMRSALYGRMQPGKCISADYSHSIGCFAPVLDHMDGRCSGRQTCSVVIGTLETVAQPCPMDFKSYLQASYDCQKVAHSHLKVCDHGVYNNLTQSFGYIAGSTLADGSWKCPWRIHAKPGQTIAITLFYFNGAQIGLTDQSEDSFFCPIQAMFLEKDADNNMRTYISLCESDQREDMVYISKTNILTMEFIMQDDTDWMPQFLLQYKAIGCPDIEVSSAIWVKRDGDSLIMRCNETNETWFLTCVENKWLGEWGNCSIEPEWKIHKVFGKQRSSHRWVIFAIIIGIILGILFGVSLLTVAFMWRKKHRRGSNGELQEGNSEETNHQSIPDELKTGYSAALPHEQHVTGNVKEYTHVWNEAPPGLCFDTTLRHPREATLLRTHECGRVPDMIRMQERTCIAHEPTYEPSNCSTHGGEECRILRHGPNCKPLYFDMRDAEM